MVYVLFFLSGFAGLIYQVIWTRELGLAFGSTAQSASTTVAAFLCGLGLGARLAEPLLRRGWRAGRLFGALEVLVAAYSLFLTWILPQVGLLNGWLIGALGEASWGFYLARFTVIFALLLPGCLAMGATLPLLTEYCSSRSPRGFTTTLARLYAINTLGAALGPLMADFVLVRAVGVFQTSCLASAIDLLVGLAGFFYLKDHLTRKAPEQTNTSLSYRDLSLLFLSGYCSICLEILWIRTLVFFNLSDVYAFTIVVSTFLLGLVLGSALATRFSHKLSISPLLWAIGAGILLSLASTLQVHEARNWLRLADFNLARFVTAATLMLPVTTILGALFPLQCSRLQQVGAAGAVGRAYLWNTLGSLLGSLSAGFFLLPHLGLQASVLWVAGLAALGSGLAAPRRPQAWLGALLIWAGCLALPKDALMRYFYAHDYDNILFLKEDHYGTISLVHQWDNASWDYSDNLIVDGYNMMSNNLAAKRYAATLAALPILLHPKPDRVLVICFGLANTVSVAVGLDSTSQVDCVELTPTVVAASGHLDYVKATLASPKLKMHFGDGRNYLAVTEQRYQVITAEPPPPIQAGIVNLYSREYFQQCRRCLTADGMVSHWLPVQQMSAFETRTILRACQEVFPHTYLWAGSGSNLIIVGSMQPLQVDFAEFSRRFEANRVILGRYGLDSPSILLAGCLRLPEELATYLTQTPPLTDDRPYLQHYQGDRQADYGYLLATPGRLPALHLDPKEPAWQQALQFVTQAHLIQLYPYPDPETAQIATWKLARSLLQAQPQSVYAQTLARCTPAALRNLKASRRPDAPFTLFGAYYAQGDWQQARETLELGQWPPRLKQAAQELLVQANVPAFK